MGRIVFDEVKRRPGGLRRRWTVCVISLLLVVGLIVSILITSAYTVYCYSAMESDFRGRASATAQFFSEYLCEDYQNFYESCIDYVSSFADRDKLELQFVDSNGIVAASSYGLREGISPSTPEIQEAMESRGVRRFLGSDPLTGERILAVSSPMIYSSGEVIGVFRYVTSMQEADRHILLIGVSSLCIVLIVVLIVALVSGYFIRSIINPLEEITEKAQKIAAGSYGVQIQTKNRDEMGRLSETINELSTKLSENEKVQTEFISSLSHELRTPLTAITGWSETLLAGNQLNRETRRGMQIIWQEAKRLTEMVVDLLDFTRIQDGRMTLNIESTDIRGEFEDTVYMYSSRLSQDGIELTYLDNDEDIPEIPCDPKRMRQVFLNILDNAAKHGEGKKIEASIHYEDRYVVVRIRDYGPGIPEDEIPLVKKKFYKGSSKARGSGIGLAVCDEIVEMHGGILTLENAPGGGALVTVCLPAVQ